MSAEEQGGRRAKRRCARNKYTSTAMPSAIHYVGYVSADRATAGRRLSLPGSRSGSCHPPARCPRALLYTLSATMLVAPQTKTGGG